jgi:hypothetical protein
MATSSYRAVVPNMGDKELEEGERFHRVERKRRNVPTGRGKGYPDGKGYPGRPRSRTPPRRTTGSGNGSAAGGKGYPRPRSRTPPRRQAPRKIGSSRDRERWFHEGKCLLCGSKNHQRRQCALWDESQYKAAEAGRASTTTARGTVRPLPPPPAGTATRAGPSTATKRQRSEGSTSGVTPEAKRLASARPVPWGQKKVHIRHKDMRSLKREENEELEHKMNTWAIVAATRGDNFPQIDEWRWRIHSVEVKVPTASDAMALAAFLLEKGFLVESEERFEASRVILHHYSGCLSETMKSVNDDGLKILIEMQRIKRKYDGRFEFLRRITDLQKGTLIELVVEEKLVESFAKDGNALRIGTSGLVVFEDRTAPRKSAKVEQELEETKMLLQELEEKQKTLQRQVDAQKAAEAEKEARESLGLFDLGNQETDGESQTQSTDGMQSTEAGTSEADGGEAGKVTSDPTALSKMQMGNLRQKLEEIKKSNLEIVNGGKGKVTSQPTAKKTVEEVLAEMRAAGTNETIRDMGRAQTGATAMETDQEGDKGAKSKEV